MTKVTSRTEENARGRNSPEHAHEGSTSVKNRAGGGTGMPQIEQQCDGETAPCQHIDRIAIDLEARA